MRNPRYAVEGTVGRPLHGLVGVLLLGILACTAHGQEPSIRAELARDRIFEGESVLYRVTVNNVSNPRRPSLEELTDFDVAARGESSRNQVTIINGHRTETRGRSYDYLLTPRRSGQLSLPGPRLEVDGRELRGNPLTLTVVPPSDQGLVRLAIEADRTEVYPLQPFTITLRVSVRGLPAPYDDVDPIQALSDPPHLTIPWAVDARLDEGLQPRVGWQRWLGTWQQPRGAGFRINGIRSSSLFSLLDGPGMGFLPKPRRVRRPSEQDGEQAENVSYWEYEFPRTFTAERVGKYSFGPANLKGRVGTDVIGRSTLEGEDVYAVARPVTVRVKDVPLAGRPASYINAIGAFEVSAEIVPREAKVGDPLTLTITLRGEGTLDTALPPDLERIAEVHENFRVYEATTRTEKNRKEFTYSLRPLNADVSAFPTVPVGYFDVDRAEYVTLRTESLPIDVQPANRLAAGDIRTSDVRRGGGSGEVADGLLGNVTDLSHVRDEEVWLGRWILGWMGAGGVFALVLLVVRWTRRDRHDEPTRRRREAAARARAHLATARRELAAGRSSATLEQLRAALVEPVAAARGIEAAGLTPGDVRRELERLPVAPEQSREVVRLLEALDAARYGGGAGPIEELLEGAERTVERLLDSPKKS